MNDCSRPNVTARAASFDDRTADVGNVVAESASVRCTRIAIVRAMTLAVRDRT